MSRVRKALYSLLVCLATFGGAEVVLRAVGYHRPTTVEAMRFTFPLDDYNASAPSPFLLRDPQLFWKPKPFALGHNSRGVLGPEFAVPKPPGRFRIVALGDSCTHFGPDPYPQRLQALLEEAAPGRFDVINAGVIGYSSHQGLARLRLEVTAWQPDIVTAYFGWNDHWLARGYSDREQAATASASWSIHVAADRLRLYQWLSGMMAPALRRPAASRPRVSLDEYRDNLASMAAEARATGAELWLITAPHALDLGVPSYLRQSGEIDDPAGLVALHERYTAETRAVARAVGAPLVDLDRLILPQDRSRLFLDDNIHLSDDGRSFAARAIFDVLVERQLVPGHTITSRPGAR